MGIKSSYCATYVCIQGRRRTELASKFVTNLSATSPMHLYNVTTASLSGPVDLFSDGAEYMQNHL